jgi:hypothetical protein
MHLAEAIAAPALGMRSPAFTQAAGLSVCPQGVLAGIPEIIQHCTAGFDGLQMPQDACLDVNQQSEDIGITHSM